MTKNECTKESELLKKIEELKTENQELKDKVNLCLDTVGYYILGKTKFKKCLLLEKQKTDNEINKYIEVIEQFIDQTRLQINNYYNIGKE